MAISYMKNSPGWKIKYRKKILCIIHYSYKYMISFIFYKNVSHPRRNEFFDLYQNYLEALMSCGYLNLNEMQRFILIF